jgi:hypothetical protein
MWGIRLLQVRRLFELSGMIDDFCIHQNQQLYLTAEEKFLFIGYLARAVQ